MLFHIFGFGWCSKKSSLCAIVETEIRGVTHDDQPFVYRTNSLFRKLLVPSAYSFYEEEFLQSFFADVDNSTLIHFLRFCTQTLALESNSALKEFNV